MNQNTITLLEEIAKTAAGLLEGTVPEAKTAVAIISIVQAGQQAFQEHTGEAINEDNVKALSHFGATALADMKSSGESLAPVTGTVQQTKLVQHMDPHPTEPGFVWDANGCPWAPLGMYIPDPRHPEPWNAETILDFNRDNPDIAKAQASWGQTAEEQQATSERLKAEAAALGVEFPE